MNIFKSLFLLTNNSNLNIKISGTKILISDTEIHPGLFQFFIQSGLIQVNNSASGFEHSPELNAVLSNDCYILAKHSGEINWYRVVSRDWNVHDANLLSLVSLGFLAVKITDENEETPVYISINNVIDICTNKKMSEIGTDTSSITSYFSFSSEVLEKLKSNNTITQTNNIYEINGVILNPSTVKFNILSDNLELCSQVSMGRNVYSLKEEK